MKSEHVDPDDGDASGDDGDEDGDVSGELEVVVMMMVVAN